MGASTRPCGPRSSTTLASRTCARTCTCAVVWTGGFVPLDHVCTFKRRDLCDDPLVVRRAVESSDRLNLVRFTDESSGANVWKVRTVDQPERWVLAASQP